MEPSRLIFFLFSMLLTMAYSQALMAHHAGWHCKSGKAIKVSWKMGVDPPDYQTFKIQVQNTCGLCDAHNVTLNLTMLAPGIWDPIVEKVRVKDGKSISPGKKVTFRYHVNYLADIGSIHSSARFIHCKLPHQP
ncbi:uncharacterized protein LOC131047060 [Cryptomeria japonica]|uniref:uncharacterized protein LOC131047060 n=1 Tax=Cryptomeria japonica TaxID=3369 RepID=UPI0025AC39A1|nr:uncharacterized protein LOC131047060 [Cryptomeria japonica]